MPETFMLKSHDMNSSWMMREESRDTEYFSFGTSDNGKKVMNMWKNCKVVDSLKGKSQKKKKGTILMVLKM